MDAQAAARLGDEIAHGFGLAAMIGGAVVGALIGAAIVGATVATGGAALAIMAGSIAAGGLSMFQIVKGLSTIFKLPEPTTGVLIRGSFDVYINSRNAMRAGADVSAVCSGLPMNHPMWPFPVLIAEGSATVYINGKPAARLQSKMVCGAHIKSGSEDTFIGGPTLAVAFVLDLEGWVHTGLEALGLLAAGGALVLAAMAGLAALGTALLIGATAWGGMALLGDLGDRLGPGYRDLFQGVAGMALLGMGAKLAKPGKPNTIESSEEAPAAAAQSRAGVMPDEPVVPVVVAQGKVGNAVFTDVNQTARSAALADPNHPTLISEKVIARDLASGKRSPNGNMADAHAEVGVIQQAHEQGLTKGQDMTMTVTGKAVCDYCRSDVVSMAKAAELKSLTIYEQNTGNTLSWEQGMKRFTVSKGE
ncbi:PAAR domain-containing protein [Pseudomonas sp. Pseusp122]|uniref:PAAR domain-containing protein n=1 Tax=unclassified Pseudomonas TaxID=196821 RepID=UPI0039A64686